MTRRRKLIALATVPALAALLAQPVASAYASTPCDADTDGGATVNLRAQLAADGELAAPAVRRRFEGCVDGAAAVDAAALPVSVSVLYRDASGRSLEASELETATGPVTMRIAVRDNTVTARTITTRGPVKTVTSLERVGVPHLVEIGVDLPEDWSEVSAGETGARVDLHDDGLSLSRSSVLFPPVTDAEIVFEVIGSPGAGQPTVRVAATPLGTGADSIARRGLDRDAAAVLAALGEVSAEGSREAADGASAVADGIAELAAGIGKLATGLTTASDGAIELAGGAGELAAGADELAGGATKLSDGLDPLTGGSRQIADAIRELAFGLEESAAGAHQIAEGNKELADTVQPLADLSSGLAQLVREMRDTVATSLDDPGQAAPDLVELLGIEVDADALLSVAEQVVELNQHILPVELHDLIPTPEELVLEPDLLIALVPDELVSMLLMPLDLAVDATSQLDAAVQERVGGLRALADGSQALAEGLDEAAAGTHLLGDGANELSGGMDQVLAGSIELARGAAELADGTHQLHDGADALADGISDAADGADQLHDGALSATDGMRQLAGGVGQLTDAFVEAMGVADRAGHTDAKIEAIIRTGHSAASETIAELGGTGDDSTLTYQLIASADDEAGTSQRVLALVAILGLAGGGRWIYRRRETELVV